MAVNLGLESAFTFPSHFLHPVHRRTAFYVSYLTEKSVL